MPALPAAYAWLEDEPELPLIIEFLRIYGTRELPGSPDNPTILEWAEEVGVDGAYNDDGIPWCGLAQGVVAYRAGFDIPSTPLWAKSWAKFGEPCPDNIPMLGDVLVFSRNGGGHVGTYVGEDEVAYHVIGGNQSDMVNITRVAKNRIFAVRRPPYDVLPENVRRIWLSAGGALSQNEA